MKTRKVTNTLIHHVLSKKEMQAHKPCILERKGIARYDKYTFDAQANAIEERNNNRLIACTHEELTNAMDVVSGKKPYTAKKTHDMPNKAITVCDYVPFNERKNLIENVVSEKINASDLDMYRDNGNSFYMPSVKREIRCKDNNNKIIDASYRIDALELADMSESNNELDAITTRDFSLAMRYAEIIQIRKAYRKEHKGTYKYDLEYIALADEMKSIKHKLAYDEALFNELEKGTFVVSHTGYDGNRVKVESVADFLYLVNNCFSAVQILARMLIWSRYNKKLSPWLKIYVFNSDLMDVAVNRLISDMWQRAKDMNTVFRPFIDLLVYSEVVYDVKTDEEKIIYRSYTHQSLYNLYKEENRVSEHNYIKDGKRVTELVQYAPLTGCDKYGLFDTMDKRTCIDDTYLLNDIYKVASKREKTYMRLYAQGFTFKEIADMLGIKSSSTIRMALRRLPQKYEKVTHMIITNTFK